ncbi:hypothetical protein BB561_000628 [Smittium simulii]|uniref:Uncharacterized protein n=1 Tax=Smittium simulii TaxID=133385 RepID=A0A2T9YYF8_9FUNG|nr:hypothetical protein BB561_000628 [Smittium simulii]
MPKVSGVIPSAAAGVPLIPTKRTRLEYSTVAKTGYIDPASKNDYNLNFLPKNSQKNDKNIKNQKKNDKFQQHNKNNVKKIIKPALNPQEFTEVSIMHLLDNSIPKALKKACYGGSDTKIGCSWTQFSGNINAAIDYVALKIDDEYDMPIPKGKAIGATLAANSGVSSDDIVAHAFWSNYSIFDSYYRLTRNSSNNLTESILNLK